MLECLVFGRRAALSALGSPEFVAQSHKVESGPVTPDLREALWEDVGLIRDARGLERATQLPHLLASLIAKSALAREESRGGHFRSDFPDEDPRLDGLHTVVTPDAEPRLEQWT